MVARTNFIFLGSKITADCDCSHQIKRCLLLGKKAMTNINSISKIRDITLLAKVCIVKAMVFPVAMYGCESWTIKKAKHHSLEGLKLKLKLQYFGRWMQRANSLEKTLMLGKTEGKRRGGGDRG